jgi:Secretion system C-terminal sorting domain
MKTIFKTLACALALTTTVAFANPTEEKKAAKFEASAFTTKDASIRVAVKKNVQERVYLTLRDAKGQVLFAETISKNNMKYAAKFDISDLADGAYQIEIKAGNEQIVKELNVSTKTVDVERKVTVK